MLSVEMIYFQRTIKIEMEWALSGVSEAENDSATEGKTNPSAVRSVAVNVF